MRESLIVLAKKEILNFTNTIDLYCKKQNLKQIIKTNDWNKCDK
ncbi:hypothetical protein [Helicobacter sp. 16-1353]|nr:hypothetical protein [Helicobacter sp. 16-1353]